MSTTSPASASSSSHPTATSTSASDRQIAEARAALEASMYNIGSHFDHTLKSRAVNLHANNRVLEKQLKELRNGTKALAKETDKLKKVADNAAKNLKEVGNLQNWTEVNERELLILEETVRLANESEEEDYGPCRVCGLRVEESGDDLLWCNGCDGEFHLPCVGLDSVPPGEWFCAECRQQGTYLQSVKIVKGSGMGPGALVTEEPGLEAVPEGVISGSNVSGGAMDGDEIAHDAMADANTNTTGAAVVVDSGDVVMGGVNTGDNEVDGIVGKEDEVVVTTNE